MRALCDYMYYSYSTVRTVAIDRCTVCVGSLRCMCRESLRLQRYGTVQTFREYEYSYSKSEKSACKLRLEM